MGIALRQRADALYICRFLVSAVARVAVNDTKAHADTVGIQKDIPQTNIADPCAATVGSTGRFEIIDSLAFRSGQ